MQQNRTLVWQFYKPFIYYNFIFNGLGIFLILGNNAAIVLAILAKIVSYGGLFFYQHHFHQHQYFYYRNAGLPVRRVYIYAITADFMVFMIISMATVAIK